MEEVATNNAPRRTSLYVSMKLITHADVARELFPLPLVRGALLPIEKKLKARIDEVADELWDDIAKAAVAFVRTRLENPAVQPATDGDRTFKTVPQLLSQMVKSLDRAIDAADEIMRQALTPMAKGEDPDSHRIDLLMRLSRTLHASHIPAGMLHDEIVLKYSPQIFRSDVLPTLEPSGMHALIALRNEASRLRSARLAGKKAGRRSDFDLRDFLVELAHLYRKATSSKASASQVKHDWGKAKPSPYLRFARTMLGTLSRETILVRPLPATDLPHPTTIAAYLKDAEKIAEYRDPMADDPSGMRIPLA